MSQQPPTQYGSTGPPQYGTGGYQESSVEARAADLRLEEALSDEMRVALHDFVQSATVCDWCAERCIDEGPGMAECIRLCRDVSDLASLNADLLSRDSVFGPEAAAVFANAAEACAQECARHDHRHCQECAEVLTRAARSTRTMLASFDRPGGQPGGGQWSGQPYGGQPGGASVQEPVGQRF